MVSMEAGRACGYRDDNARLPTLSLGLSSVRLIVNKFELQHTRVTPDYQCEVVKYDPNIDETYEYDDSPLDKTRGRVLYHVAQSLSLAFSKCIPSVSFGNFGVLAVTSGLFAPRMISYLVLYPFCRLVFGTLYPAYASYKAVRTKNLKEYVKWMMYWIVFALFTCTETFTDVFLSWFPFYYEVKIVLVLWLLSPATKGSSILYRKFVHPALCRREQEIDEYIAKAKDQGYHTVLNLGTKGVNYATTVIMQTAIKGGGGLVQQIRKSYSLSDLTECEPREDRGNDEADDVMTEPRLIRRAVKGGYSTRRSASESNSRSPMYFPEVDVDVRPRPRSDEPDFSHIKSTEDISSGYSSADNSASLTRTASLGAAARARSRTTRTTVTTIKRPQAAEGSEVIIEELRDDDGFEYANMPSLVDAPSQIYLSHTDPPFLYQYVGDQVKIIQVLGNYPINRNINIQSNDTDDWDEKETVITEVTDNPLNKDFENKNKDNIELVNKEPEVKVKEKVQNDNSENADACNDIVDKSNSKNEPDVNIPKQTIEEENEVTDSRETPAPKVANTDQTDSANIQSGDNSECVEKIEKDIKELDTQQSNENIKQTNEILKEKDTPIVDKTVDDVDSADSDDEASFGTPENSPKSKKKAKGKYGKSKAPLPPLETKTIENDSNKDSKVDINVTDVTTSQESLIDIVNKLPNTPFKETGTVKTLQVVNPIAENKRRHKSKSPGRVPKSNSSGIGRLLQLPSKLAFWNRADDKPKSDISVSSGDNSRRSSNIEQATIDEFQSCIDLTKVLTDDVQITKRKQDDEISFKDATEIDDPISNVIVEKSDALQRLIDAKLESHPEYKIVPLHEEIPTTSKSTDV